MAELRRLIVGHKGDMFFAVEATPDTNGQQYLIRKIFTDRQRCIEHVEEHNYEITEGIGDWHKAGGTSNTTQDS